MKYQMPEPLDTVIAFFRGEREFLTPGDEYFAASQVQAAYAAGRAAGLEAAAKVCDTEWNGYSDSYEWANSCNECADAIRNLAKETPCA